MPKSQWSIHAPPFVCPFLDCPARSGSPGQPAVSPCCWPGKAGRYAHSRLAALSPGCGPPCSTFCKLSAGLSSTGTSGDRMGSTDAALDPRHPRTPRQPQRRCRLSDQGCLHDPRRLLGSGLCRLRGSPMGQRGLPQRCLCQSRRTQQPVRCGDRAGRPVEAGPRHSLLDRGAGCADRPWQHHLGCQKDRRPPGLGQYGDVQQQQL